VRTLRSVLLFTVLVLALSAAGCGGSDSDVPEVPGAPAELSVPHQKGAADLGSSATPTPSASATGTATPSATPDSGTTGSTGSTGTTGGTGTNTAATPAPATQQDSATNDTKPADGSAPQQFEQFCQENAGAC
jgi:hypothetical protein